MCIVGVKAKGVMFPTEQEIKNCMSNNPDGFAMAWNEYGKLRVFKSMSDKKFLKKYKAMVARCDYKETAMVFHARIATHGTVNIKNCHCWEGGGMAFAHNGILSVQNRDDMTDSETFFRDIFLPIYKAAGWGAATRAINACIGSSKFAFIDGNGTVAMFGNYQKEKDKNDKAMFWSNATYSYEQHKYYGGYGLFNDYPYYGGYGTKQYSSVKSAQLKPVEVKPVTVEPAKSVRDFDFIDDDDDRCGDIDWEQRFRDLGYEF